MKSVINDIIKRKIVAILRNIPSQYLNEVVEILIANNIRVIEVTLNSKRALEQIHELSNRFKDDILLGAGTVISKENVIEAKKAGAKFLITPVVSKEVAVTAKEHNLPVIMGAMTPTEIGEAIKLGAELIKVFPINNFGPEYIKDVLAPLNNAKLMAVGGVTPRNAREFIENGALTVGIGSSLVNVKEFSDPNWKVLLGEKAKAFNKSIN